MSYPVHRRRVLLGGAVAALLAPMAVAQPPAPAPKPRVFGGKVIEVNAGQGWFVMTGGASKKYARVKVLHDKKTRWEGPVRKNVKVKVGDQLQAEVNPAAGGAFRAVKVRLHDPNRRPSLTGATPGG